MKFEINIHEQSSFDGTKTLPPSMWQEVEAETVQEAIEKALNEESKLIGTPYIPEFVYHCTFLSEDGIRAAQAYRITPC